MFVPTVNSRSCDIEHTVNESREIPALRESRIEIDVDAYPCAIEQLR